MPRVSVCLLSYNQRQFLAEAIDSVRRQTFADWELIVIDNGSTDGSRDVLDAYRREPKIRIVLNETNEAPTRRLNQAVAASAGEFISVLYSDDFYLPDKLRLQVEAFERLPPEYGVVYSPGDRLDIDTGNTWTDATLAATGEILKDLLLEHGRGRPINPISPLVRRACFERHPFYEDLFVEGELVFFRIAMTHRFHFIPQSTVVMRDHAGNRGRAVRRNVETLLVFLDKLEHEPEFPATSFSALKVMRGNLCRLAGWLGIRTLSDPAWSRAMMLRAVRIEWRHALHPKMIAALSLSTLTPPQLRRVNQFVDRVRPARGHSNHVEF